MTRWRITHRRRPYPRPPAPRFRVRLSCGHELVVGPGLPLLGDAQLCPHLHGSNVVETITEIQSV